jgi:pyruvate dehydrogenase E2 component (dihydrolipoamide acetyltransferase)/2-oxoglutarate dehydrogenase E2 component (dihydrolipoamide succinyltransferase)
MPHDVTMPQLGMAQDAGRIVSWLKAPGDAVARGDALFEVETDKATMEIEAQASGFLTDVTAAAGQDVPVGDIIARISESPGGSAPPPAPTETETATAPKAAALPEGHRATMPQLGMAQDTGLLVSWLRSPGDQVAADDMLFEVETDKSTMEVPAGRDGWLAATLAHPGEEVPVGAPVAIISDTAPDAPVALSAHASASETTSEPAPEPAPETEAEAAPPSAAQTVARPSPAPAAPTAGGRILASPKARRLAREQGLDLARLVAAGHPQPFHVADLEVLRTLQAPSPAAATGHAAPSRRLTAECAEDGVAGFADWAAGALGLTDADAILAGLAGASLAADGTVRISVERFGVARVFDVPPGRGLASVTAAEDDGAHAPPALILRDLRATALRSVALGPEDAPALTLARNGAGLAITLECAPAQMDAGAAIRLLSEFAGRVEQPLRHLL